MEGMTPRGYGAPERMADWADETDEDMRGYAQKAERIKTNEKNTRKKLPKAVASALLAIAVTAGAGALAVEGYKRVEAASQSAQDRIDDETKARQKKELVDNLVQMNATDEEINEAINLFNDKDFEELIENGARTKDLIQYLVDGGYIDEKDYLNEDGEYEAPLPEELPVNENPNLES